MGFCQTHQGRDQKPGNYSTYRINACPGRAEPERKRKADRDNSRIRSTQLYVSTGLVLLAIAQVHHEMGNSRPDWHAWVSTEIKFRLNHHRWIGVAQMLQIEARNAFDDTKVVWDSERGELIAKQERLKSALQEVQQREEALQQEHEQLQGAAQEASLGEEALRKEHESLQHEYSRQKDE
ncbi:hypothetical protein R1sor_000788 [Riccia sorocarpa]|uniref:Uncharacterized protein n=1 Tax=Riccia sorocarpa TaxID=122646 RepID=A0ABD3GYA5_9MARC